MEIGCRTWLEIDLDAIIAEVLRRKRKALCGLKIDTGMERFGCRRVRRCYIPRD